ncbi:hypothetical protein K1T71_014055 [Dendrolimus kikuchii]|uniref:Uncharacterized protein n=1 Tax=Dendrolimus kikuchii TaxID=765133 RepID=A0ACC1CF44_9NEOP|nr:hypothetical protein K1T71_014055 [Dendrolimus kikuchii]
MADVDCAEHWYNDRLCTSERDSDDSPILSHRHRRYAPYIRDEKERDRRSTCTFLAKSFMFCTAMILLCVVLYIPVYNKANDQIPKGLVTGWSVHTNRDTKIYVRPNNVTTVIDPKDVCLKDNNLFLLIVVCSSTENFEERRAIRETWGSYKNYILTSKLYNKIKDKYKKYNYTYDLYNYYNFSVIRNKRDISSISQLLPELAKALKSNFINTTNEKEEKRFDDDMLPEFDMNNEISGNTELPDYEFDYPSNVMRIPPRGYEDNPDLEKVLFKLKNDRLFQKFGESQQNAGIEINTQLTSHIHMKENEQDVGGDADFKLVFLLGLPGGENFTDIQGKIKEEADKYGDVLQEGFIDSYNNLTLKSIMMLKWITNNCSKNVRYILKTDDDMYINVPSLMENLRNRSKEFDGRLTKSSKAREYMLIGDLIYGARPVHDSNNKWYSPRYMYGGRVYPKYLSGTGYALSSPTAEALYQAALRTNYFHLEDIYITGVKECG